MMRLTGREAEAFTPRTTALPKEKKCPCGGVAKFKAQRNGFVCECGRFQPAWEPEVKTG